MGRFEKTFIVTGPVAAAKLVDTDTVWDWITDGVQIDGAFDPCDFIVEEDEYSR